ncbi:MAG: hypothetical protein WCG03_00730 [Kiritimatiellales bacterium]
MNKILYKIALASLIIGASASAERIASESFLNGGAGYNDTANFAAAPNTTVLAGTTGFTNTAGKIWQCGTATIRPRNYTGLTHALVQGTTENGLVFAIPANDTKEVKSAQGRGSKRVLAAAPAGSSFYMSGLVSLGGSLANLDASESVAMGLNNSFVNLTWNVGLGMHLGLTRNSAGDVYLAAFAAGNTYTLGSKLTLAQAAETQMIVLKLDIDTSGNNDTLTAWIAQQGSTNLTEVLSQTGFDTGVTSDLSAFVVQSVGNPANTLAPGAKLDEFRFGTTLQDVTIAAIPSK